MYYYVIHLENSNRYLKGYLKGLFMDLDRLLSHHTDWSNFKLINETQEINQAKSSITVKSSMKRSQSK